MAVCLLYFAKYSRQTFEGGGLYLQIQKIRHLGHNLLVPEAYGRPIEGPIGGVCIQVIISELV